MQISTTSQPSEFINPEIFPDGIAAAWNRVVDLWEDIVTIIFADHRFRFDPPENAHAQSALPRHPGLSCGLCALDCEAAHDDLRPAGPPQGVAAPAYGPTLSGTRKLS